MKKFLLFSAAAIFVCTVLISCKGGERCPAYSKAKVADQKAKAV